MRTATAAVAAVKSIPPHRQRTDSINNRKVNGKAKSEAEPKEDTEESRNLQSSGQEEFSETPLSVAMNPVDMLVADSGSAGVDFSSSSVSSQNEKYLMTSTSETGAIETVSTAANVASILQAAGFGQSSDLSQSTRRLWKDLEDFIERGLEGIMAAQRGDPGAPSEEAVTELQLQTARTLRQILPSNRELLYLVQEKNWITMLLGWLNLHDRPVVQVEALLALTNIADLCQQTYHQHHSAGSLSLSTVAAETNLVPRTSGVEEGTESQQIPQAEPNFVAGQNPYMCPEFPCPYDRSHANATTAPIAGGSFPSFINGMGSVTASDKNDNEYVTENDISIGGMSINGSRKQDIVKRTEDDFKNDNSKEGEESNPQHPDVAISSHNDFQRDENIQPSAALSDMPLQALNNPAVLLPQVPLSHPSDTNAKSMSGSPASFTVGTPVSPALVTAFNSSFPISQQRSSIHPPMMNNSTPMVCNYPQPLSVCSQHLLLRHTDTIPTLVSLLSSPNRDVHEQAMWILGSIVASDSPSPPIAASPNGSTNLISANNGITGIGDKTVHISAKEAVLAAGVMTKLLKCLEANPQNLSLQRIGSWALSNLVETKIQQGKSNKAGANSVTDDSMVKEIEIKLLLPTLRRLLNSSDHELLSYTCWALSHLCDGPSSNIAAVVTSHDLRDVPGGLVPRLVDLLLHASWRVTKPALRTIGNIVCAECGDDINKTKHGDCSNPPAPADFTEVILDCEAVPRLKLLITHGNREIQKEACWTLSNIAAGTVDQIQAVIDSKAIPPLVHLVNDKNTDQEVRSEACWVVLNATSCGSDQQIEVLVSEGCVSVLGLLLEDTSMVSMALEGLERVLQVEEHREASRRVRAEMRSKSNIDSDDESDCLPPSPLVNASLIKRALEKHNSNAVYKRAERIWNNHFVCCKLCRQSFSKHRPSDAKFCNECKCYVCSNCNCEVYHLSYQEELWAASEERKEATKRAKKNKRLKKKEKRKEKNKTKQQEAKAAEGLNVLSQSVHHTISQNGKKQNQTCRIIHNNEFVNTPSLLCAEGSEVIATSQCECTKYTDCDKAGFDNNVVAMSCNKSASIARQCVRKSLTSSLDESMKARAKEVKKKPKNLKSPCISPSIISEEEDVDVEGIMKQNYFESDNNQPPIDFVLYLQQTGSIIALARLMDALDEGHGYSCNDETDMDHNVNLLCQNT